MITISSYPVEKVDQPDQIDHVEYVVQVESHGEQRCVGQGPSLEAALIEAEKALRTDLDEVQTRLHAVREAQKTKARSMFQKRVM